MFAPLARTLSAVSVICSTFSTEHGPAKSASLRPPTFTPPQSITLSVGWNFRFAFLNGSETGITRSTPG